VSLLGGSVKYIPKRPGEPDCTYASTEKIKELLSWKPIVPLEDGVKNMLNCIGNWRDAPVWDAEGISKATETWFKYLGK
jgi:UDP-glucose 4-epimerase